MRTSATPLDTEAALDRAGEPLDLGAENIQLVDNDSREEIPLESFIIMKPHKLQERERL